MKNPFGKRHKYSARPTVVDGIRFASAAEARRYGELKMLERAGEITGLELQPRFPIEINGKHVFYYVADFRYTQDGRQVVEDVKGVKTEAYMIKKKCAEAMHSISITEVKAR